MSDKPRLLIVDDEAVVCQACHRIFSRQGYEVEESTDAREGLNRALKTDYSGVLLDIKMPEMDGIQFLEEMRKQKPDLPVLIMTGYPSVPNAAAAVRLGASDYVTKPFTPEQITQSVRRLLAHRGANGQDQSAVEAPVVESWVAPDGELLFLDESWVQPQEDGSACVGAVVPRLQGSSVEAVQLPQVGDVVYQGLPLAGFTMADESVVVVPSPISGVVVAVNDLIEQDPSRLSADPCGRGWIACICTTRLEEEIGNCKPRRVLLASANEALAGQERERLASLGCQVRIVAGWDDLAAILPDPGPAAGAKDPGYDVLVLDAHSFGAGGVELVRQVNRRAPSLKIVVACSADCQWGAEYRQQRIFYYAVAPFADHEIHEIIDAVFRALAPQGPKPEGRKGFSEPLSGIRITNHNGHKVQLLAAPGLLRRGEGLGLGILRLLAAESYPVVTTPGDAEPTASLVLKTAGTCERVMVLTAEDTKRLPGTLVRDTKAEYVSASRENAGKVTTLVVQPDPDGGTFAGLDDRTTAALAKHIAQEMASY